MRMRVGLGIGLAVGYVLGARAGRERYEDLKTAAGRVSENPIIKSASDLVRGKVDEAEQAVAEKLGEVQDPVGADFEEGVSPEAAATAVAESLPGGTEGKE